MDEQTLLTQGRSQEPQGPSALLGFLLLMVAFIAGVAVGKVWL